MQLAICASEVGSSVGECCVCSVLQAKLEWEVGWEGIRERVQGNAFEQNQDLDFRTSAAPRSQSVCLLFHPLSFFLLHFPLLLLCPALSNHLLFSAFPSFILALHFFFSHLSCVVLISSSPCVYLSVFLPLFTFLVAGSPSGVSVELTLWTLELAVFAETVVFHPEETFSLASQ